MALQTNYSLVGKLFIRLLQGEAQCYLWGSLESYINRIYDWRIRTFSNFGRILYQIVFRSSSLYISHFIFFSFYQRYYLQPHAMRFIRTLNSFWYKYEEGKLEIQNANLIQELSVHVTVARQFVFINQRSIISPTPMASGRRDGLMLLLLQSELLLFHTMQ